MTGRAFVSSRVRYAIADPGAARQRPIREVPHEQEALTFPMQRRARLPAFPSTSKSGPVTIRSMSSPRNGWTLEQALALVAQGYTPAHVERLTGWHAKQLEAHRRGCPGAA